MEECIEKYGYIIKNSETNTIIKKGYADSMEQVNSIVDDMDKIDNSKKQLIIKRLL